MCTMVIYRIVLKWIHQGCSAFLGGDYTGFFFTTGLLHPKFSVFHYLIHTQHEVFRCTYIKYGTRATTEVALFV